MGFTKLEFKCNGNLQDFIQNKKSSFKTEEDFQKFINDSMRQLIYEENKLKNLTVDLTLRKILITEDGFKLFDFSESNCYA